MTKITESKIPITDFLEAYKGQPCLYNSFLDTYKNRASREEAYEAMISSLKIPQLTVLDIKLKIKSIRTVYTKELRILTREKELGRCYEPKLFWFKRADSFLRSVSQSHCKRLKTPSNVPLKKELIENTQQQEEDDESESGEQLEESYASHLDEHGQPKINIRTASIATSTIDVQNANSQTTDDSRVTNKTEVFIDDSPMCIIEQPPPSQQQQHAQQEQQHQTYSQQRKSKYAPYVHSNQQHDSTSATNSAGICFSGSNGTVSNNDDNFSVFGQSVASQLRAIRDSYSRSVAKLRIQQVLFEAETGQSSEGVSPHLHTFQHNI